MTISFETFEKALKNSNKFPSKQKELSPCEPSLLLCMPCRKYFMSPALPCHSSAQQRSVHISTFLIIDVSFIFIHIHGAGCFGIGWRILGNRKQTVKTLNMLARMVKYPVIIASAQNFHQTTNNFRKCLVEHTNTMDFSSPISRDSQANETFIIFNFCACR